MPRKKTGTEAVTSDATPAKGRRKTPAKAPVVADAPKRRSAKGDEPAPAGARSGKQDLVIVESPAKAKTITKYLGPGFVVLASYGHVRDLPKKRKRGEAVAGITLNGWIPTYVVQDKDDGKGGGKGFRRKSPKEILAELKNAAKKANRIFLATDPDREGEAIAWHLFDELKLDEGRTFRITFNEITRAAVQKAIANPSHIDMDRVKSQEARRILDRIVGFPLSGLLGKKVTRGLSAGRVQSVAVRLIVEREREIAAFRSDEYWKITALLSPSELAAAIGYHSDPARSKIFAKKKPVDDKAAADKLDEPDVEKAPDTGLPKPPSNAFLAELVKWDGSEFAAANEAAADAVVLALANVSWTITKLEQKDRAVKAQAPFTTSTLQQAANQRLKFSATRTMQTAQKLYEGIELGDEGAVALITYMRTDSTRVSADALNAVRNEIQARYGPNYVPAQANVYASGKSAQEAHEAIRPTDLAYTPQRVAPHLTPDQLKLYTLIYNRFVASQMAPAIDAVTNVEVTAGKGLFKAQGRVEKFDGHRKVWPVGKQEDTTLPLLRENQNLSRLDLFASQHFTQPPPRFNEASLVKALEKEGIGRPSTYASIIETIQKRGYVRQEHRRFFATEIGMVVTDLLIQHFPKVMDVKFTSHFEEELDQIERREAQYEKVLDEFWGPFKEALDTAETNMPAKRGEETGEPCPKCGKPLVIQYSRKGGRKFVGCSGWREGCKYIKPPEGQPEVPEPEVAVNCPVCGKPMQRRYGPRGAFLGCTGYPDCRQTMQLTPEGQVVETTKITEHRCDKCGEILVLREGRRGPFLSCSGYPKCKNTMDADAQGNPIKLPDPGVNCDKCGSPMAIRKGPRGPFLGCSAYPKCRSYKPVPADLKEKLKAILPPPAAKGPAVEVADECPDCGGPMVVRSSRRGPFLGCKAYPKCKGTKPMPAEMM